MKKFWSKLVIFGALYLIIVGGFLVLSATKKWSMPISDITKSGEYAYEDFGAKEIMPYVERVQKESNCTKLVIGDSVCHQMFARYYELNDVYCISGTNQAITLAGQYILAKEFIESHEGVTDIYLVVIMESLATDYGIQLGYQYAVMPFVATDTIQNLDSDTRDEIADIYGRFFCQKPVVKLIDGSPLNTKLYLNLLAKKEKMFPKEESSVISEVAWKYLENMYLLCEENGITFHLLPGPHADIERRHETEKEIRKKLEEKENKLGLEEYLDKIVYYPEEMFRDGVHFDEKKVSDSYLRNLAKEILPEIKVE